MPNSHSMDTKVTLKLSKRVIDNARAHQVSLSQLIENYLGALRGPEKGKPEIPPFVKSLGVSPLKGEAADSHKSYLDYLEQKYR